MCARDLPGMYALRPQAGIFCGITSWHCMRTNITRIAEVQHSFNSIVLCTRQKFWSFEFFHGYFKTPQNPCKPLPQNFCAIQ